MNEEIDPARVAAAAREGFEGLLVPKGHARRLAGEHPLPDHAVESAFARHLEGDLSDGNLSGSDLPKSDQSVRGQPEANGEGGGQSDADQMEAALREAGEALAGGVLPPGEEEVFKSNLGAEKEGRLIDRVQVRVGANGERHLAELSRLGVTAVIPYEVVQGHERLLQDGLHTWITLRHDPESGAAPYTVERVDPLEPSGDDLLRRLSDGRAAFSPGEWAYFLARSLGLAPFEGALSPRALSLILLRLVPLCERNYNLVELGPRGTGKSHLFGQLASRAHLLSGGKASVSKLFVHTGTGERGLITSRDVVVLDEISSTSFQGDEVVSALKDYMESGQVSRGKESVQGEASVVMLGNIDRLPRQILKGGHLFESFPDRISGDTAIMDRIHAYLPGWEVPKIDPGDLAEGLGLPSGFLAECLHRLRRRSLTSQIKARAALPGNFRKRDRDAALKTASGLLKLIYPGLVAEGADKQVEDVPRPVLRWALWLAVESRLRVRQQQWRIHEEFEEGDFRLAVDPPPEDGSDENGPIGERVFLPEERPR